MLYEDGMFIDFNEETRKVSVMFRGETYKWVEPKKSREEVIKRAEEMCQFLAISRPKVA